MKIKYIITCLLMGICLLTALPARAVNITYTYDDNNRLTAVDYGESKRIAYTYDEDGNLTARDYDRKWQLAFILLLLKKTTSIFLP